MKKLIMLLPMFLFIIPIIAFAEISQDPDDYLFWENGDITADGGTGTDGSEITTGGWSILASTRLMEYDDDGNNNGNMSILANSGGGDDYYEINMSDGGMISDMTVQFSFYDNTSINSPFLAQAIISDILGGSLKALIGLRSVTSITEYYYRADVGSTASGVTRTDGWHNFTYYVSPLGDYIELYIDEALIYNRTSGAGNISVMALANAVNTASDTFWWDDLKAWQGTPENPPQITPKPPIIKIIFPENNSVTNIPFDVSINVTDVEDDVFDCLLRNSSFIFSYNHTVQDGITAVLSYGKIGSFNETLNVTCFDNSASNLSSSSIFSVYVDTLSPLITINSPVNNSFTKGTMSIDLSATDESDMYRLNYTLFNSSFIVRSRENLSTATELTLIIKDSFDTTSISDGYYQMNITAADAHTARDIPDYGAITDAARGSLSFITPTAIINITIIDSIFPLATIAVEKELDRYTFGFKGGPPVRKWHEFIAVSSKPMKYMADSHYTGHFITGRQWIDFVNDDPLAVYNVSRIDEYSFSIRIFTNDLDFHSIGDLNVNDEFIILAVNNNPPVVSGLTPLNNSFTGSNPVTFSFTATDPVSNNITCQLKKAVPLVTTIKDTRNSTGLWRFEKQQAFIATDSSGNGFDGNILNGAANASSKGSNNTGASAIDLDGVDDFIRVPDPLSNFSFGNGVTDKKFSAGAWVYMHDATTFRFFGKREGGTDTEWFFTVDSSDKTRFQLHDNSAGSDISRTSTQTETSNENKWTHYTVTYDGSGLSGGMRIYRNGVSIDDLSGGSGVYVAMEKVPGVDLEIGSINNGTSKADGLMDEVFVIPRQLTPSQVLSIYNNGFTIIETTTGGDTIYDEDTLPSGSSFSLTSALQPQGTGNHSIFCYDNIADTGNLSSNITLNISVDTVPCAITLFNNVSGQNIDKITENLTIDASNFDLNIVKANWSLFNASETADSNSSSLFTGDYINFTDIVNTDVLGTGSYTVRHECDDPVSSSLSQFSFNLVDFTAPVVSLISPPNESSERDGSGVFTYSVDIFSSCSLFIDGVLNKTQTNVSGQNTYSPVVFLSNNTQVEWYVNCTTAFTHGVSGTFLLNINLTQLPAVPREVFSFGGCPDTVPEALLLFMFFSIAIIMGVIGISRQWGIMGILGGLMMMFSGMLILGCSHAIAYIILGMGLVMICASVFSSRE